MTRTPSPAPPGWTPPPRERTTLRTHARALGRGAAAPVLAAIRRSSGRTILWTPPSLGGGNHLYMWLWAWEQRRAGNDAAVLRRPGMEAWIAMFPALGELTVDRAAVPFTAQRREIWHQGFDEFGQNALDGFLDDAILGSPAFAELLAAADTERAPLTLNIRRGDYYTDATFRRRYGMDIRAYALAALEVAEVDPAGAFDLQVVSDDPAWCAEQVPAWLPAPRVRIAPADEGPFGNLARLAASERLILANSTFSYWAGYLKNRWDEREGRESLVVAPRFHVRTIGDGRAWQLAPAWTIIENAETEVSRSDA
ncbi:alpha-1,2-fucosyltransferase [Brachybacterium nesterenkovii]|uniref:alpha-1,2-fucosyltransferase n=1 Tax=Brachybacterium nesterenkovii TaxID=47847 RepID=UPI00321B1319